MNNVRNKQQSINLPQYLTLILSVRNMVINYVNFYPSSLNATISVRHYYIMLSTATTEYSCRCDRRGPARAGAPLWPAEVDGAPALGVGGPLQK